MGLLNLNIEERKYLNSINYDGFYDEELDKFILKKRKFETAFFNFLIQEGKISPKVLEIGMPINDELRLLLLNHYIENYLLFNQKKSLIDYHYRIIKYIITHYFDHYDKLCDIILLKIKENQDKIDLEDIRDFFYEILDTLDTYPDIEKDPMEEYDVLIKNKDLKEKYFALKFEIDNTFHKTIKEKAEIIFYDEDELEQEEVYLYNEFFIDENEYECDEKQRRRVDDFDKGEYNNFLEKIGWTEITTFFQFSSKIECEIRKWINIIDSKFKFDINSYNLYDYTSIGMKKYSAKLTYKEIQEVNYLEFFSAIMHNKFHIKHLYIYLENQLKFNDELIYFFIEILDRFQKKANSMLIYNNFPDDYLDIFDNLVKETINSNNKIEIVYDKQENNIDIHEDKYKAIYNQLKDYITYASPDKIKKIIQYKINPKPIQPTPKKTYFTLQENIVANAAKIGYCFGLKNNEIIDFIRFCEDGMRPKITKTIPNGKVIKGVSGLDNTLIKIRNEYLHKIDPNVFPLF